MKKVIAFTAFGLSTLLFVAGSVEAGCGSRGGWGHSQPPAHQPYYYHSAPAPTTASPAPVAQRVNSYRSFSFDPGVAQPGYEIYAPSRDSALRGANDFRANRKRFGLSN